MTLAIFDGHNDVLSKLFPPGVGPQAAREARAAFYKRAQGAELDLPRARQGGLGGGFFSVFAPPEEELDPAENPEAAPTSVRYADKPVPPVDAPYARAVTQTQIAHLFRLESESRGEIRVVRTAAELDACLRLDILAVVLHMEGAEAIDPDLDALHVLHRAGLRSLGIVWSRSNAFGHGVPFRFPATPDTGPGLTAAGLELVAACNRLGILVDLSHLNEKGFWDVARATEAPLVATHSAVHALCPSPRNLTDKQLDAIGASGGIVGVNFHVAFLREDGAREAETPMAEIVRHARYVADRIGIQHVALGSDFDGALMPRELGDAAGLPGLLEAFRADGFGEPEIRLIAHENWLRVLRKTWKDD